MIRSTIIPETLIFRVANHKLHGIGFLLRFYFVLRIASALSRNGKSCVEDVELHPSLRAFLSLTSFVIAFAFSFLFRNLERGDAYLAGLGYKMTRVAPRPWHRYRLKSVSAHHFPPSWRLTTWPTPSDNTRKCFDLL